MFFGLHLSILFMSYLPASMLFSKTEFTSDFSSEINGLLELENHKASRDSGLYYLGFGPITEFSVEGNQVEMVYRFCRLVFREDSWYLARTGGYNQFSRVFYRLHPNWFDALDRLIEFNQLSEIHFSSTWRPSSDEYSNVHSLGKGMDITYVADHLGEEVYFNIDSSYNKPTMARQLYRWAERDPIIRQYIDPWQAYGVHPFARNAAIRAHRHHLHLTIR